MQLKLYEKKLDLPQPIVTSLGTVTHGKNYFLVLEDEDLIAYGEAASNPFNDKNMLTYSNLAKDIKKDILSILSKIKFRKINLNFIKEFHSTFSNNLSESRAAFDILFHDYISKKEKKEVWKFYTENKNKNTFLTKTIGTNNKAEIIDFIQKEKSRIKYFKIKGTKENLQNLPIKYLSQYNVIIDFNGAFNSSTDFVDFIEKIPEKNEFIFEEPFLIDNLKNKDLEKLNKILAEKKCKLIFDDSFFDRKSLSLIKKYKISNGFNIKIQKIGGIYPSYILYKENTDFQFIIGCVLESSLGISASSQLGRMMNSTKDKPLILDLDSDIFLGLEDKSPKINIRGREPEERYGIGFIPNLDNADLIYQKEV